MTIANQKIWTDQSNRTPPSSIPETPGRWGTLTTQAATNVWTAGLTWPEGPWPEFRVPSFVYPTTKRWPLHPLGIWRSPAKFGLFTRSSSLEIYKHQQDHDKRWGSNGFRTYGKYSRGKEFHSHFPWTLECCLENPPISRSSLFSQAEDVEINLSKA